MQSKLKLLYVPYCVLCGSKRFIATLTTSSKVEMQSKLKIRYVPYCVLCGSNRLIAN